MELGADNATPLTARRRLCRRVVMIGAAALLAVGAFLLWGPIGLGSGPLSMGSRGTEAAQDAGSGPFGFLIPVHNAGHSSAVITGIELAGRTSFPAPRLISVQLLGTDACGPHFSTRLTGASGYSVGGCGAAEAIPLIGRALGFTPADSFGYAVGAKIRAPLPGTCVVVTNVIVHYRVGIRHFTTTDPFELAVCTQQASRAAIDAAVAAAEAANAPG